MTAGARAADVRAAGDGGAGPKPQPGDGITITGGAGGTKASLVALATAAARAERAASHLSEAARRMTEVAAVVAQTADLSPATATPARDAAELLATGPRGLQRRSERLLDLAAGLRGAAQAYASADDEAAAILNAITTAAGRGLGELPPGAVVMAGLLGLGGLVWAGQATLTARVVRYTPTPAGWTLQWLGNDAHRADDGPLGVVARLVGGPGLVPEIPMPSPAQVQAALPFVASVLLGLAPGRWPSTGEPVAEVAALVALSSHVGNALRGRSLPGLLVTPLVTPKDADGQGDDVAPRTVTDVLREVDSVAGDVDGAVGVQRIDHADGTRSWVVTIPGTQDLGFGGPTTTDVESNVELMAGLPNDRTDTVLQAMEQSGIRRGEPVLLAGHSQGGMVAVRLAQSLDDTYAIAGVLTAGSPVGGMPLPDDIPALHLEHVQDYVPALDSTANPDEPNRTTVTRDLTTTGTWPPSAASTDLGAAFVSPHDLSQYIVTADLASRHKDRSVQAFLDAIAPALDDGSATVTTTRYVGVRVPDDASRLAGATSWCGTSR